MNVIARSPEERDNLACIKDCHPIWSAMRYGQSLTFLPDGCMIRIGGEHEDGYDPDFRIYNDVFVKHPSGQIQIIGYPEANFPPTDNHSATLVGKDIFVIGGIGYSAQQRTLKTLVFRLNIQTLCIEAVPTTGPAPSRLYCHESVLQGLDLIEITGGKVLEPYIDNNELREVENAQTFCFNLASGAWSVVTIASISNATNLGVNE